MATSHTYIPKIQVEAAAVVLSTDKPTFWLVHESRSAQMNQVFHFPDSRQVRCAYMLTQHVYVLITFINFLQLLAPAEVETHVPLCLNTTQSRTEVSEVDK